METYGRSIAVEVLKDVKRLKEVPVAILAAAHAAFYREKLEEKEK